MTTPTRPAALITGASGGIGLELARLCAKGGHDVILVARNGPKLEELGKYLAGMYGVRAEIIVADLRDPEAPRAIMDEIAARGMGVDVLVNNAGIGDWGLFGRGDLQRQLAMIQVNITALTELTRLALPRMVTQRKGRILNVGSTAGFAPGPLMAVYYATKAFVVSFSQAIGEEFRGTGITVTVLCPGPTRTGFAAEASAGDSNLFSGSNVMAVEPVALAGYRAMMRGAPMVIPGVANKLLIFGIRTAPRWLLVRITRWFQERRKEP